MNIRKKIGQRITEARKSAGLTVRELSERTTDLKPARISNWEHGTRIPGPQEAMQLANVLGVEAGYLLCVTDHKGDQASTGYVIIHIPILPIDTINQDLTNLDVSTPPDNQQLQTHEYLPLSAKHSKLVSNKTFAITIQDKSMFPDFLPGDIIIIDANLAPKPGQYVLANLAGEPLPIFRKYKEIEKVGEKVTKIELVALNDDWPKLQSSDMNKVNFLGSIIEVRRCLSLLDNELSLINHPI